MGLRLCAGTRGNAGESGRLGNMVKKQTVKNAVNSGVFGSLFLL